MMGVLRVPRVFDVPLLSRDSGPGLRWLLFLQGCGRPCTTVCLNPQFLSPARGEWMTVHDLGIIAEQVAVGTWGTVEGLTLLGGEPTDQAASLELLLPRVRALGLSVMLYSGHRLRWFFEPFNRAARRLLDLSDILVDGPFLPELVNPELRWRGSRNQRVIRLTCRYSEDDLESAMRMRGVTLRLVGGDAVTVSGLQDRQHARAVEAHIRQVAR